MMLRPVRSLKVRSAAQADSATSATTASSVSVTSATTTPTPTAGTGSFTGVSASVTTQKVSGANFYFVVVTITITTNGTAAGFINVALGITASKESVLAGRAVTSGTMVQGIVPATSAILQVLTYNNLYPGASGERITLSGVVYV